MSLWVNHAIPLWASHEDEQMTSEGLQLGGSKTVTADTLDRLLLCVGSL